MRGHACGHLEQLAELRDPEKFVDVNVPVVALGALAVVAQKIQRGRAVRRVQHNGVAREADVKFLGGNGRNVRAEHLALRPCCGKKNLVVARQRGVFQRLLGKVPGGPDLAAFEVGAVAVNQLLRRPLLLIVKISGSSSFDVELTDLNQFG